MRKLIVAALAAVGIVACRSSSAPDLTTYAGNYVLRSINDTLMPYTVAQSTNYLLQISADTIFMATNGTFVDATHYKRTNNGVIDSPADSLGGVWRVDGANLTFQAVTGDLFSANLTGSTITLVGSGSKAVYTK